MKKKFNFNDFDDDQNDNYHNDNNNNDDEENNDIEIYYEELELESVTDETLFPLISNFITAVIYSFRARYLSSDNDFDVLYNLPAIKLWNYVYDEFERTLKLDKFLPIKESEITLNDLDKIFNTILNIIDSIMNHHFDNEDNDDDNDDDDDGEYIDD